MTSTPKWDSLKDKIVATMNAVVRRSVGVNLATKWLMSDFTEARDEAVRATREEILATFDEMVTLRPKEAERSDIVTFRNLLRRLEERKEE